MQGPHNLSQSIHRLMRNESARIFQGEIFWEGPCPITVSFGDAGSDVVKAKKAKTALFASVSILGSCLDLAGLCFAMRRFFLRSKSGRH